MNIQINLAGTILRKKNLAVFVYKKVAEFLVKFATVSKRLLNWFDEGLFELRMNRLLIFFLVSKPSKKGVNGIGL